MEWPADTTQTTNYENMADPIRAAFKAFVPRFAWKTVSRKHEHKWLGLPIGPGTNHACPQPEDQLTREGLDWTLDRGRDVLDELIAIGIRLGFEQGRRINAQENLAFRERALKIRPDIIELFFREISKDSRKGKSWPPGFELAKREDISGPIREAFMAFAPKIDWKEATRLREHRWTGLKTPTINPTNSLSREGLDYILRQGEDVLDVLIDISISIGAEQGRRDAAKQMKHFRLIIDCEETMAKYNK